MKVALISTPTRTYMPNTYMPLGIMQLDSYLELRGHTVMIIDAARTRQNNSVTINDLREFKPDLIGISGIITAFKFVKELGRGLKKEFPAIPVVVGGHIVLDISEILLKNAGCDYTINGYGEEPLVCLMEFIEDKRRIEDVPGLSYLKDGKVIQNAEVARFANFDDTPLPAYYKVDMEHYVTVTKKMSRLNLYLRRTGKPPPPMRFAPVSATRGCPYRCSFCVHEFSYKAFHIHSMEYLIKNIKLLYDKYGVRIFDFGEEMFLYNREQARELVHRMNTNFPDAYFSCMTRANYITEELIDILKNSNCFKLGYGFESGSNRMLEILNKGVNRDVNTRAYQIITKSNIVPGCSFMVGTPGETEETIKDTLDSIKEAKCFNSGAFFTTPYPGSRLFRWCVKKGFIKDIEAYLDSISDCDATKLRFNLTPYPDIIVKMMQILVSSAMEKNKVTAYKRYHTDYRIPLKRLIIKHWVIPVLFSGYFLLRKTAREKQETFYRLEN